jgi:hypothetical protein
MPYEPKRPYNHPLCPRLTDGRYCNDCAKQAASTFGHYGRRAGNVKALRNRLQKGMKCETLLKMRYLTFMTWEQIAAQLNYSNDYIYHLHRKALSLVWVLPS